MEAGGSACPFCKVDPTKIIIEGNHVRLLWCNPPHKHTKKHLLIVPKNHITTPNDFMNEEWLEFLHFFCWALDEYDMKGGGLGLRFGDPMFNAGSIEHFHWNLWEPDGTGRVQMTLAKEPEENAESAARAGRFAAIYERLRDEGHLEAFLSDRFNTEMPRDWDGKGFSEKPRPNAVATEG
ncbi:MAG TPA: hypothetical protein VJB98_01640 [Candidatus Paceibacterota bacterium]